MRIENMAFRITKETSNQEIFDYVVSHLRAQGARSLNDENECTYRSVDGYSCAVGCLIPDDLYTPSLEGRLVNQIREDSTFNLQTKYLGLQSLDRAALLQRLQRIHDNGSHWSDKGFCGENAVRFVASMLRLVYKEPTKLHLETA
jgi:hypothetical protein